QLDLVVIDERAWAALDATQQTALRAAVEDGLGLLLRVTGPLDAAVAADWSRFGFRIAPDDVAGAVVLADSTNRDGGSAALTRHAITVEPAGLASMLRARDGSMLAAWGGIGRGRVGMWWLADSFRLALAGD